MCSSYEEINNNNLEYHIKKFDTKQELVNNKLITKTYSGYNILMWVMLFFTLLVCIIILFQDDELCYFKDSYDSGLLSIINCEEIDGIFYYTSLNRLISKRNELVCRSNALYNLGINSISDILFFPKNKLSKKT